MAIMSPWTIKSLACSTALLLGACAHPTSPLPPQQQPEQPAIKSKHSLEAANWRAAQTSPASDPFWRQRLTKEAQRLNVTHIEQLKHGVYGEYNQSRVFFSTVEQIPSNDKFYQIIVNVLSDKYKCFMVKRRKAGELYRFYCRDRRSVIIRHGRKNNILHFFGRAYDDSGRLIPIGPH